MTAIEFSLEYHGFDADSHSIEFYDVAQALAGFQRSLAITSHLILNGEVITQAPALKGAKIYVNPPEIGSWKINSRIILASTAIYTVGTADRQTPVGHLISSAYDYVISETMGFHVDYDESLGQSYEKLKASRQNEIPIIEQSQLDSVIEKTEASVVNMHRPIIWSKSASRALVTYTTSQGSKQVGEVFTPETWAYISETYENPEKSNHVGRVASYNMNTFKGRIFISSVGRPISFELSEAARDVSFIILITDSLRLNARDRRNSAADLVLEAIEFTSRTGTLKKLKVISVRKADVTL